MCTVAVNIPEDVLFDMRMSESEHLSNAQSADLLASLLCDELECVVGMHVSQNNNDYRLPREALAAVLEREGHPARALVGFQSRPVSV